MVNKQYFKDRIFAIRGEDDFEELAIQLFHFQAEHNEVYAAYLHHLGVQPTHVRCMADIPFLPISFFKTHAVRTGHFVPGITFTSSGTGGAASRHHLHDVTVYEQSFNQGFHHFYGHPHEWCTLALLPAYLERKGSSLVYMAQSLIAQSKDADSNFYLNQLEELHEVLLKKKKNGTKTLLLGVSFALLDLVENHALHFPELTVMETGGMKGRRKEVIRHELHRTLKKGFGVAHIHSEYGMTELLSQAYSYGEGLFRCPPWMRVFTRPTDDPFGRARPGKTGGLNVVDLANIDSCGFIETQDLARLHENGQFEVMGRFDNSDIRGCNLMVI